VLLAEALSGIYTCGDQPINHFPFVMISTALPCVLVPRGLIFMKKRWLTSAISAMLVRAYRLLLPNISRS
jgi:hypothetical protein